MFLREPSPQLNLGHSQWGIIFVHRAATVNMSLSKQLMLGAKRNTSDEKQRRSKGFDGARQGCVTAIYSRNKKTARRFISQTEKNRCRVLVGSSTVRRYRRIQRDETGPADLDAEAT